MRGIVNIADLEQKHIVNCKIQYLGAVAISESESERGVGSVLSFIPTIRPFYDMTCRSFSCALDLHRRDSGSLHDAFSWSQP